MGKRWNVPDGCTEGVAMKDGTVYYANRHGQIEVDSPRHNEEIRRSDARNEYDMISPSTNVTRMTKNEKQAPTELCVNCSFEAFAWCQKCPRCHRSVREVEPSEFDKE